MDKRGEILKQEKFQNERGKFERILKDIIDPIRIGQGGSKRFSRGVPVSYRLFPLTVRVPAQYEVCKIVGKMPQVMPREKPSKGRQAEACYARVP